MTGSQILFTSRLRAASPVAFTLRHNVDAIVWDLDSQIDLEITHKYTLQAFGFIQVNL